MALTDNIISYWKLDESSGNADDAVSTNDLTNTGTVPYAAGKINNGADFQGTNQILESASAIGFTAGGARTWNFWFKADVNGGYMLDNITNSGAQRRVTIYLNGTNLAVYTWNTDIDTGQAISTGTWYMATVCWNNGTITTYVNAVAKTGGTSGTSAGSANGFALGADYGKTYGGSRFNGIIDEVGVWDRVLSGSEITSLYNSGNANQYPFSIAYILSCVTGAFTLTGNAVNLTKSYFMQAVTGAFNLVGNAVNLVLYKYIYNVDKPTPSIINSDKISIGETWDSIDTTWATEIRTWGAISQLITNPSKPTPSITNQNKP